MDLIAARLCSQGLTAPLTGATAVVRKLVGLQAQDEWVAPYAIRPRALDKAEPEGVVINWLMRGTLHMVAREDAQWLTHLLGPRFAAKARPRRLQLGLTDDLLHKAVDRLRDRLPGTREELLAAVDVPPGQARAHLLGYAGLTGVMVRRGDVFEPMPAGNTPADPLGELARRYLEGYGPADATDFAAWSGLPLTTARKALPQKAFGEASGKRVILLGHLDPYLLGYKDRSFALDPAFAKKVQRGGGFLQPVVLVDGRVHGVWSRQWRSSGRMLITVDAFGHIPRAELEEEVADLGRYFNCEATISR